VSGLNVLDPPDAVPQLQQYPLQPRLIRDIACYRKSRLILTHKQVQFGKLFGTGVLIQGVANLNSRKTMFLSHT
jgi:hypothetical protein